MSGLVDHDKRRVKAKMSVNRMGMTSHRGFPVSLPSMAILLSLANETDGGLSYDTVRTSTNLGTIYAEAMPKYARAAGLLDDDMKPSRLGYSY
jgi:hypothetical protein